MFAIEKDFISNLSVNSPPGMKIQVKNVPIRRGLLLFTPSNVLVLGGSVDKLIELKNKTYVLYLCTYIADIFFFRFAKKKVSKDSCDINDIHSSNHNHG